MSAQQLMMMSWVDVEAYLEEDDRAIVPVGSIEQHGRHLPFNTDSLAAEAVACGASEITGVLVTPTVQYGMSLHHLCFPGSIGLHPETLTAILTDVLASLYHHGFRRVLVLNGHGGNNAAIDVALTNTLHDRSDLEVVPRQYTSYPSVVAAAADLWPNEQPWHAALYETSLVLALQPQLVRLERAEHTPGAPFPPVLTRYNLRATFPHGVIGSDPRLAMAEAGRCLLEAAVADCAAELSIWKPRPGAARR